MSCAVLMRAMPPFQPLTWGRITSSSQVDSSVYVLKPCSLNGVHRPQEVENHLDRSNAIHTHWPLQEVANAQHRCCE